MAGCKNSFDVNGTTVRPFFSKPDLKKSAAGGHCQT